MELVVGLEVHTRANTIGDCETSHAILRYHTRRSVSTPNISLLSLDRDLLVRILCFRFVHRHSWKGNKSHSTPPNHHHYQRRSSKCKINYVHFEIYAAPIHHTTEQTSCRTWKKKTRNLSDPPPTDQSPAYANRFYLLPYFFIHTINARALGEKNWNRKKIKLSIDIKSPPNRVAVMRRGDCTFRSLYQMQVAPLINDVRRRTKLHVRAG
jgi:hypothetical protein